MDTKKREKIIIINLIFILSGCSSTKYREIITPALELKKADQVQSPIYFGEIEPPIPTKEEIENQPIGIDRNNNGIRDDIDIYINRTFKDYNLVMVARQFAFAYENFYRKEVEWLNIEKELIAAKKIENNSQNVLEIKKKLDTNSHEINKDSALMINAQECLNIISHPLARSPRNEVTVISTLSMYPEFRDELFARRIKGITEISYGKIEDWEGEKFCSFKIENLDFYKNYFLNMKR